MRSVETSVQNIILWQNVLYRTAYRTLLANIIKDSGEASSFSPSLMEINLQSKITEDKIYKIVYQVSSILI